jgi:hypothetical protein
MHGMPLIINDCDGTHLSSRKISDAIPGHCDADLEIAIRQSPE